MEAGCRGRFGLGWRHDHAAPERGQGDIAELGSPRTRGVHVGDGRIERTGVLPELEPHAEPASAFGVAVEDVHRPDEAVTRAKRAADDARVVHVRIQRQHFIAIEDARLMEAARALDFAR